MDRDVAVLVPLASPDEKRGAFKVEVHELEAQQLAGAQAREQERGDQGVVAAALERIPPWVVERRVENGLGLLVGQAPWQGLGLLGFADLRRGVARDQATRQTPVEELLEVLTVIDVVPIGPLVAFLALIEEPANAVEGDLGEDPSAATLHEGLDEVLQRGDGAQAQAFFHGAIAPEPAMCVENVDGGVVRLWQASVRA